MPDNKPMDTASLKAESPTIYGKTAPVEPLAFAAGKSPQNGRSLTVRTEQESIYAGPLPSAEDMLKYAEVFPELPERIFEMARAEQQHRFAQDEADNRRFDEGLRLDGRNTLIGMFLAIVAVALIMGASVFCAKFGHPVTSGIIGTGGVVLIVTIFITGARIQSGTKK